MFVPDSIRLDITTATLLAERKRREQVQYLVIVVPALVLTPLLVLAGVAIGFGTTLGLLAALAILIVMACRPRVGFFVIAGCAVIVDWQPLAVPIGTDRLPIWSWPAHLAGLPDRPIGLVFLFVLLVVFARRLALRQGGLDGGVLLRPLLLFLAGIAVAVVHGLVSGGDIKVIVMEVRPFEYLLLAYLLAYNLVSKKQHVRAFFWLVIAAAGVKALQGVYIVYASLNGHVLSDQNEIMGHEDSFFFICLLLLILLFSLHHRYRPQLYAALAILPPLVIALLANNRRADYLALLVGAVVAWLVVIVVKPSGRRKHVIAFLVCMTLGIGYVAMTSHTHSWYAEPARAVMAIVSPDPTDARDAGSNLYRLIENYDLLYTERQNQLLGYGFGKPFLQPGTLPNIGSIDPIYLYVPHNTIYWVWMRAGPLGFFGLWYLLGSIIMQGAGAARRLKDRYLQVVAIYVVAVVFMEVIVAYADYQLFNFRNVIFLGLLAGLLMRLPALDSQPADTARQVDQTSQDSQTPPAAQATAPRVTRASVATGDTSSTGDTGDTSGMGVKREVVEV